MTSKFDLSVLNDVAGDQSRSLSEWLRNEDDLGRAEIRSIGIPPREGEMGTVLDLVQVVLQPGGVGEALIAAVVTWLSTRSAGVRVAITKDGRTVEIEAPRNSDVEAVIRSVSDDLNAD